MESMNGKVRVVILAAGQGKRMQGENPKVLAELAGKHMIRHLLGEVEKVFLEKPIVVVGYKAELVKKELGDACTYVYQREQLGTGHAVLAAREAAWNAKHIVVLQSDQPFVSAETIKNLIQKHTGSGAKITFTTTELPDFEDWRKTFLYFGRILRKNEEIIIHEYKDASEEEREIKEVNAGSYVFEARWLWENLKNLTSDNVQKEYYLTELLQIASVQKEKIQTLKINPREALGANTKEELEILEGFAYNKKP